MTIYWVDSVGGDNGKDGLSKPNAWETIVYAESQVSAGDTITLVGGATYATRQVYDEEVLISGTAGTSGNPITITNETNTYVEISSATGAEALFDIREDYWRIIGQAFDPFDIVTPSNPYILLDREDASDYAVQINGGNNCTLQYLGITNGAYNPSLVRVSDGSNTLISYCRIYDNAYSAGVDRHGLYIGTSGNTTDDTIVEYCYIYEIAGDCIQLQNTGSGSIADTIIRHCWLQAHSTASYSENGIDDKDGNATQIHNNTIWGFRNSINGDGQALVIHDRVAGNFEIYNNEIYDISGAALSIDTNSGTHTFRHNLIHTLANEGTIGETSIIYVIDGNLNIYNNTVDGTYGPEDSGDRLWRFLSAAGNIVIKNNIFHETGNLRDDGAASVTAEYSCWHDCLDTEPDPIGGTDISGDPLFTNPGADDYTLQGGSPCRDAGTDLGYPYQGSDPDMGAFEYEDPATIVYVTVMLTVVVRV